MSMVSISEAARLAGVSRSTLYRVYIKSGKISVSQNDRGQPVIDVAELLRVFKHLPGVPESETEKNRMLQYDVEHGQDVSKAEIEHLRALLRVREEELARALDEVRWLRGKVDALEQRQISGPGVKRRWWWPW